MEPPGKPWWRIGVADGIFAAFFAATRGTVVARGATPAFLAPLPIELIGDDELSGVLRRLGIGTLGAFAALDDGAVLARFGTAGATLRDLAAGRGGAFPAGRSPARPEEVEKVLDPPALRLEATLFVARGLADELGRSLARRGLSPSLLAVEVELSDGSRLERRWTGRGSLAPGLVAERLRAQIATWAASRHQPGGRPPSGGHHEPTAGGGPDGGASVGVAGVRLVALEVAPSWGDQLSLWGRRRPAEEERVARVAARVQGMLGPSGVLRPATGGGRGPREQARLLPFGEERSDERAGRASVPDPPWPGRLPGPSPAVVPPAPVPAEVRDADGALLGVDGRGALSAPPACVSVGGGPAKAVRCWSGPFPVDERWWEGAGRRRRARLQVVLADGEAFLLSLERGRWAVEGSYD